MMNNQEKPCIAVFPGAFDPPTNGHLQIILDAVNIYKFNLIIVPLKIFDGSLKKETLFSLEERVTILKKILNNLGLERVVAVKTLNGNGNLQSAIKEFIKNEKVKCIIRGIRSDNKEEEIKKADEWEKKFKIPVFLLLASPENKKISSNLVKKKLKEREIINSLVPEEVLEFIKIKNL